MRPPSKPLAAVLLLGALAASTSCKKQIAAHPPARPDPSRQGYVDLVPLAELEVLNAYFKEGSKHELSDYIGTHTAHFQAMRRGLRLLNLPTVLGPIPHEQNPASHLVPASMQPHRHY